MVILNHLSNGKNVNNIKNIKPLVLLLKLAIFYFRANVWLIERMGASGIS